MKPLKIDKGSNYSDKEIDLFSNGKKRESKKGRKGRKSTWNEIASGDLAGCICSNEFGEKKLILTDNKASKNAEIYQKINSEVRKRYEERKEAYE